MRLGKTRHGFSLLRGGWSDAGAGPDPMHHDEAEQQAQRRDGFEIDKGLEPDAPDRAVDGANVASHIASDNLAGGAMAAKFLSQQLQGKGNVLELQGVPGTSAARDRGKGFDDEAQKDGLKIIAQQPANFDRAQGLSVTENLLQAHPDANAIFAQNDEMALGALRALDSGKHGSVVVVAFDGTPDGIKAVKDGKMAATVAQQPGEIGRLGVETAQKLLSNQSVDKSVAVPLKLVTKDSTP